ncbi:hypothetical protein EV356DRAFT_533315 [Viridothelium virens]|uniref:Uncharacterized protein n=1 Tax=Viridothelium virens TaxID=1048519 RepID=A0A6A6H807_VIRVR|nr:hypothetical protein EV356DRAFT_533315 [Viridothelium virens]
MSLSTQPAVKAVAPSKSKGEFFAQLGLSEHFEKHRVLYERMKSEAIQGRDRVNRDPMSLAPQYQGRPDIRPPYEASHITETAKHREILRIYNLSSSYTRPWYDLGRYQEGANEENWIIRWLLWHVFRYSDHRRRSDSTPSSAPPRTVLPYDPTIE